MKSRFLTKIPALATPVLAALFFSLECYLQLKPFGTVGGALLVFAATAAFGMLLHGIARILLRDKEKAALWATIVLLTVCFFSYILTVARNTPVLHTESRRYVLVALACAWCLLLAGLKRTKSGAQVFRQFSTVVLLALSLYGFARVLIPAPEAPNWGDAPQLTIGSEAPDIYYILLDGHTSPESLQRYWNYDAGWFVRSLESQGFHVISNAQANFDSTAFCMATVFNAALPPSMPRKWGGFAQAAYIMERLAEGHVKRALQKAGYEVVELSVFPGLDGATPFYRHSSVVSTTVPGLALMKSPIGHAAEHMWVRQQGSRSLQVLERVTEIAATPASSPRFVYAHVLLPHNPYFFDRDGNAVLKGVGTNYRDATKDDYLDQLIYLDRVLTNIVAKIKAGSRRPPVIILQGDHGYRGLTPDDAKAAESLTILHALHLPPGTTSAEPYAGITPVNTFRLLFNRYFSADLRYAEDKSSPAVMLAADAREVP